MTVHAHRSVVGSQMSTGDGGVLCPLWLGNMHPLQLALACKVWLAAREISPHAQLCTACRKGRNSAEGLRLRGGDVKTVSGGLGDPDLPRDTFPLGTKLIQLTPNQTSYHTTLATSHMYLELPPKFAFLCWRTVGSPRPFIGRWEVERRPL